MLDEGDKAICAEIAGEVTEKVLQKHIESCPHGIKLGKMLMLIIGTAVGSAAGGGGIVAVVMHMFSS